MITMMMITMMMITMMMIMVNDDDNNESMNDNDADVPIMDVVSCCEHSAAIDV